MEAAEKGTNVKIDDGGEHPDIFRNRSYLIEKIITHRRLQVT